MFNLSRPLTQNSLQILRQILSSGPTPPPSSDIGPKLKDSKYAVKSRNAGVMIPFCNVDGRPGILFEARAKGLRSHSGEVSFPGGRIDETDKTFLDGALRETKEELGIYPEDVEVLGEIRPPELNLKGDMIVWPYVGFVHARDTHFPSPSTLAHNPTSKSSDPDAPLPSLDITQLRTQASPSEVGAVFHVPLSELTSSTRVRSSLFRHDGGRLYWTVDVTDLVREAEAAEMEVPGTGISSTTLDILRNRGEQMDEVGPGREGMIEIWGLTGWYLTLLMRKLGIWQ